MGKPLSIDLRERVLGSIDAGLSCRQAAARFGVSASSAIRWRDRQRREGTAAPRPQGGDQRSRRIEAHAALILSMVEETPDLTLTELQARLRERGIAAGIATLWRFFARRRITRKKRPPTPRSRTVRIS